MNNIKSIRTARLTIALATLSLLAFGVSSLHAQGELLRVVKGKSIVLKYREKIKTVSLANEDIADVVSVTPVEIVIIGKEVGITSLKVWGESETHTGYDVKVERDVTGQQVVLEVQVAEVNKSALTELGIDFLIIDKEGGQINEGTQTLGSYAGGVTSPKPEADEIRASDGTTGILKWIGRKDDVYAAIRALQRKGDLRLLANPRLLSLSGEPASFLVGGEIPVPIAQSITTTGIPNITIQWKEYGVKLKFLPAIVDTNLINLRITPEVSSLDWANSVSFGGYDIPALRTRKADAAIELNSQQSVVLGGLLSTESFTTISRVPILGSIPILKFLFSRKETTTMETELLIVVSPRIITAIADEIIPPLPGEVPETVSPAQGSVDDAVPPVQSQTSGTAEASRSDRGSE